MPRFAPVLLLLLLTAASRASDLGALAHFSDLDKHGFGSSQSSVTNIPSGGVAGVGDGWLEIALNFPANLGAQTQHAEFIGPHVSSGATGVTFWLRDTGADDSLEIHVGVGQAGGTVYFSTQGFDPPGDRWQRYHVSFSDPSAWTRTKGTGSLLTALETADRLIFRHDTAPLTAMPNDKVGDFGVDRIAITPCDYEVDGMDAGGANVLRFDTWDPTHIDSVHTWVGQGAPPLATGFLLLSLVPADLALFGGRLLVDPGAMLLVPVSADGAGEVLLPLPIPDDPALVGGTLHQQLALQDPGQPAGWALSNRLSATFCD